MFKKVPLSTTRVAPSRSLDFVSDKLMKAGTLWESRYPGLSACFDLAVCNISVALELFIRTLIIPRQGAQWFFVWIIILCTGCAQGRFPHQVRGDFRSVIIIEPNGIVCHALSLSVVILG
jgi:hypothetical protein